MTWRHTDNVQPHLFTMRSPIGLKPNALLSTHISRRLAHTGNLDLATLLPQRMVHQLLQRDLNMTLVSPVIRRQWFDMVHESSENNQHGIARDPNSVSPSLERVSQNRTRSTSSSLQRRAEPPILATTRLSGLAARTATTAEDLSPTMRLPQIVEDIRPTFSPSTTRPASSNQLPYVNADVSPIGYHTTLHTPHIARATSIAKILSPTASISREISIDNWNQLHLSETALPPQSSDPVNNQNIQRILPIQFTPPTQPYSQVAINRKERKSSLISSRTVDRRTPVASRAVRDFPRVSRWSAASSNRAEPVATNATITKQPLLSSQRTPARAQEIPRNSSTIMMLQQLPTRPQIRELNGARLPYTHATIQALPNQVVPQRDLGLSTSSPLLPIVMPQLLGATDPQQVRSTTGLGKTSATRHNTIARDLQLSTGRLALPFSSDNTSVLPLIKRSVVPHSVQVPQSSFHNPSTVTRTSATQVPSLMQRAVVGTSPTLNTQHPMVDPTSVFVQTPALPTSQPSLTTISRLVVASQAEMSLPSPRDATSAASTFPIHAPSVLVKPQVSSPRPLISRSLFPSLGQPIIGHTETSSRFGGTLVMQRMPLLSSVQPSMHQVETLPMSDAVPIMPQNERRLIGNIQPERLQPTRRGATAIARTPATQIPLVTRTAVTPTVSALQSSVQRAPQTISRQTSLPEQIVSEHPTIARVGVVSRPSLPSLVPQSQTSMQPIGILSRFSHTPIVPPSARVPLVTSWAVATPTASNRRSGMQRMPLLVSEPQIQQMRTPRSDGDLIMPQREQQLTGTIQAENPQSSHRSATATARTPTTQIPSVARTTVAATPTVVTDVRPVAAFGLPTSLEQDATKVPVSSVPTTPGKGLESVQRLSFSLLARHSQPSMRQVGTSSRLVRVSTSLQNEQRSDVMRQADVLQPLRRDTVVATRKPTPVPFVTRWVSTDASSPAIDMQSTAQVPHVSAATTPMKISIMRSSLVPRWTDSAVTGTPSMVQQVQHTRSNQVDRQQGVPPTLLTIARHYQSSIVETRTSRGNNQMSATGRIERRSTLPSTDLMVQRSVVAERKLASGLVGQLPKGSMQTPKQHVTGHQILQPTMTTHNITLMTVPIALNNNDSVVARLSNMQAASVTGSDGPIMQRNHIPVVAPLPQHNVEAPILTRHFDPALLSLQNTIQRPSSIGVDLPVVSRWEVLPQHADMPKFLGNRQKVLQRDGALSSGKTHLMPDTSITPMTSLSSQITTHLSDNTMVQRYAQPVVSYPEPSTMRSSDTGLRNDRQPASEGRMGAFISRRPTQMFPFLRTPASPDQAFEIPSSGMLEHIQPSESSAVVHRTPDFLKPINAIQRVDTTALANIVSDRTESINLDGESSSEEPDIEALARQVYTRIRRRLMVESERLGR